MLTVAGAAVSVSADTNLAGGSGMLSANANFAVSGNNLVVTLTNDATADVLVPADVLTTLFFRIEGPALALTPVSALLGAGSTVIYDDQPAGGVVGGEWQYIDGLALSGQIAGLQYGLGSAGLGVFGSPNFPGGNLAGPAGVNGLQYGIVSAGDNAGTGNGGVTGSGGLIHNSVVFTLSGLPDNFDVSRVTAAFFLYGTAFGEGGFLVPTPATGGLLGLAGLMALRRRR
ncbi:MAG: XDD4 family exosortase-dependent surface protein [Phycisphaerales bacterium]